MSPVIDYTKEDILKVIPPHSVDFVLDTTGQSMSLLPIMTPSTGMIISISTMPSGGQLQDSSLMQRADNARLPMLVRLFLDVTDAARKGRAKWSNVSYEYIFLESNADDLALLSGYVEAKKLVPVVGTRVGFRDIDKVREAFGTVYQGKGGIGKAVVEIL